MVKGDGKYNSYYAQATSIWNKQKGGPIVKPRKGTPEYDAIKKIEQDIRDGKIQSLVRTKEERDANKVRNKAKANEKSVVVQISNNPDATFEKKQVLEPEANPRPEYQKKPPEKTPDEVALKGGVQPANVPDEEFYSALSENRMMNKKLYKKMLLGV